ncbi:MULTISPECIES: phage tail assembly chaperone [Xanthomonas]|uniref:phage tail assembly chaperone n=1 Tax=Xanthomonas TaxID=338 RepID=UPI001ADC4C10|nr:hypothetical protein [Xanthomonas phaseoli]MBO9766520.1 hypothetical protein [Xanthomonas phaseoli pv. dieffenbachiae]MBO9776135.1 hypothetical protein [Xanthomonas phaseoli pv. dieffenbachiae]MBO9778267.1 hypothetical protein [Xanthomonas phaseoli pv. dieffenbachiae]MBO9795345.1 hypothetical protein [Xanthomonas phaseoli pv. dieffenbachiae]MBO9801460.1 hypothetical protein [Xanthomonas phaseoli pv. dieffenbachiae]
MPDAKGETRRERNARFEQPTPDVDMPEEAAHVWEWFWLISGRRGSGPEALSYTELSAWQQLTCRDVLPHEVAMLMAMDDAYLRAVREEQAAARERPPEPSNTWS